MTDEKAELARVYKFDDDGYDRSIPNEISVQLSTGIIAEVVKGKGKTARQAQMIAGKDQSKVMGAMTALCTKVDGQSIAFEDLEEMLLEDYLKIQGAFAELNFSLVPQI
jgi:uncharacterized membrane protein